MAKYEIIVLLEWQPVATAPSHLELTFICFSHFFVSHTFFDFQFCFEKYAPTKFLKCKKCHDSLSSPKCQRLLRLSGVLAAHVCLGTGHRAIVDRRDQLLALWTIAALGKNQCLRAEKVGWKKETQTCPPAIKIGTAGSLPCRMELIEKTENRAT